MTNQSGGLVASALSDLLTALGFGSTSLAGSVAGVALEKLLSRRVEQARDILLEEIGHGLRLPNDPGDVDEFVAVLYRYMSKAREGAARLNLRLMANVVRGQLEGEGLYASDFLRYSQVLASLTREEVILLATRHRLRKAVPSERVDWEAIEKETALALIPSVFTTDEHLNASMIALQRTGLVWPGNARWNGRFIWHDTPLLDQVVQMAAFEKALECERPT